MARADLHSALVLDREIWDASRVDSSLLDPVVRVASGVPGVAEAIVVVRDYQGPQGEYSEWFALRDGRGRTIAEGPPKRVRLSGEAFEDRVVDVVDGVYFETGDEHTAVFYVDDDEVGSIPVFIEAGLGGDPWVAAKETLSKALAKGAVAWVTLPRLEPAARARGRGRTVPALHQQPVWYVFDGGKVYVFSGPTEQQVPGLAEAREVTLTARSKDLRSRVSNHPATVRVVPSDDALWDRIAKAALGRRLNLPDGDGAVDRWRSNCTLVELTPVFGGSADGQGPAAAS